MTTDTAQQSVRKRRWPSVLPYLVLGVIAAFVAVASWAALTDPQATSPSPAGNSPAQASYPAPSFDFTLFDGNQLALSDLRGKAVVLNFWASWCPPCNEEARGLERALGGYKDRGVVFVGVDIQDTEEDARAFMKEFGITYPNGQDTSAHRDPLRASPVFPRPSSSPRTER